MVEECRSECGLLDSRENSSDLTHYFRLDRPNQAAPLPPQDFMEISSLVAPAAAPSAEAQRVKRDIKLLQSKLFAKAAKLISQQHDVFTIRSLCLDDAGANPWTGAFSFNCTHSLSQNASAVCAQGRARTHVQAPTVPTGMRR